MEARNLTAAPQAALLALERILCDAQVDPKACYQCGKCSAGCPVAADADMTPRQVMRHLQLGQAEAVLKSKMPWLCAGCGMCLARCPQEIDLPSVMLACRREAKRTGSPAVSEVNRFNDLFISGVRQQGTSNETTLAMRYNLTTGHLLQDALSAPKMMKRGMLELPSKQTNKAEEVAAIIDKARAVEQAAHPQADDAKGGTA
ncbi:MAG: 4Fe-4S dicluster domain-containing protein [Coriobacteriia bacterium]|nr:4Fe-4S dicluster domain-containing protein [Coriobacteriia bacterium]